MTKETAAFKTGGGMAAVTENRGLTTFHLKLIAVVTMLIDHTGAVFRTIIPPTIYTVMRCIGRLAFPIFCFLLVEGFFHTRSRWKYAGRLAAFCLISEPCYNLAFHDVLWYRDSQNVFWTLLIGFVMMLLIEELRSMDVSGFLWKTVRIVLIIAVPVASGILAFLFKTDYSYKGILMILAFYAFRKHRSAACVSVSLVNLLAFMRLQNLLDHVQVTPGYNFYMQDVGVLAILPILLYNGQKGRGIKWFFYLFYPVHLLILYLIRLFLQNAAII